MVGSYLLLHINASKLPKFKIYADFDVVLANRTTDFWENIGWDGIEAEEKTIGEKPRCSSGVDLRTAGKDSRCWTLCEVRVCLHLNASKLSKFNIYMAFDAALANPIINTVKESEINSFDGVTCLT